MAIKGIKKDGCCPKIWGGFFHDRILDFFPQNAKVSYIKSNKNVKDANKSSKKV